MSMLVLALTLLFSGWFATITQDTAIEPMTIDGAEVTSIASNPVTGITRYVAVGETLFRVGSEGAWTQTGTLPGGVTAIQDSTDPEVLWSGGAPECYRGGGSAPLMRSADGGATWTDTGIAGLAPLASWSQSGIVLAGGCPGLHISVDNGMTFQTVDGVPLGMQVTSFAVEVEPENGSGPVVLAGLTGEGGTTYLHRIDLSDPAQPMVSDQLLSWFAISPIDVSDDGVIYVGAPQGVLISEDEGKTWKTVREGLESTTLEADPLVEFPPSLEPGSFGFGALLALGDLIIVAGVDGLYQLDDGGTSWTRLVASDAQVTSLAATVDGTSVLAQTETNVLVLPIDLQATPVASPAA